MANETKRVESTAIQAINPDSPAGLMERMMSHGNDLDVEKFGKMLEFHERYEANQARKAYHVAMGEFQAEAPKIIKSKEGHNCKYAGLSDIVAVIAPMLSQHGLSHSWVTEPSDKEVKVTCKITHVLGHSEETTLSAGPDASGSKNNIQALGSTITYLQRYTLKAALGLAESDQDDDGDGAGDDDKPKIPKPTEAEMKVIAAICEKLPPVKGKVVDEKKVTMLLFTLCHKYPKDMVDVGAATEFLVKKNKPEMYKDAPGNDLGDIDNG